MDEASMSGDEDPELRHRDACDLSHNDAVDVMTDQHVNIPAVKGSVMDSNSKLTFHIDTSRIQSVPCSEQNSELQNLGLQVYDQDAFEQGVLEQVDEEIAAQEQQIAIHMLEKELNNIYTDIRSCEEELRRTEKVLSMMEQEKTLSREAVRQLHSVKSQKENKLRQMKRLNARKLTATQRLTALTTGGEALTTNPTNDAETLQNLDDLLGLGESSSAEKESDRMMRLGEMTPFGTLMPGRQTTAKSRGGVGTSATSTAPQMSEFGKFLLDQEKRKVAWGRGTTLQNKKKPKVPYGGSKSASSALKRRGADSNMRLARTKKAMKTLLLPGARKNASLADLTVSNEMPSDGRRAGDGSDDDDGRDESWVPDEEEEEDVEYEESEDESKNQGKRKRKSTDWVGFGAPQGNAKRKRKRNGAILDDGDEGVYRDRLRDYDDEMLRRSKGQDAEAENEESGSDVEFDGGFRVPGRIWNKLYRYQKTGVRWLWELHCQQAGGILGDEMGLGKTIQLIGFLAGLRHSKLRDQGSMSKYAGLGPTLIVCPATVMHQWVKEMHLWWPIARVAILHSSGTANVPEATLVQRIARSCGVLVTSYSTVVARQDILLRYDWHYIVLDEGHKIRNPDAQVTLASKQFRTCHRLILSGSPIQNNLKELWSLFDFVFPGKLGTLPDFMQQFSVPIVQGGYANASNVQVQTAYRCACVLRDTIAPYLLRRMKSDVKVSLQLPDKNEQVLFCRLSQHQRDVYREYLDSKECKLILDGRFMVFPGLITLRKICNHPDLSTGGPKVFGDVAESIAQNEEMEFGYWRRSGKLIVVESLLGLWKKQNHKVLLFSQSRQMLDILESFVQQRKYSYLRMDGATTIATRQPMVELFNKDPTIFLFLLTTRVGGLGINLTGADRVIIYDPDWNPSTDMQARERAWRIGQMKQVTIYRLLTTGTIEEKIYHRQIFKQFLTNRVLKDPKQRRFFKSNDLFELFMLGDDDPHGGTETSAIFAGTNSDVKVASSRKSKPKKSNLFDALKEEEQELGLNVQEQEDEQDAEDDRRATLMRELAKRISEKIQMKSYGVDGFGVGQTESKANATGMQSEQSAFSSKVATSSSEDPKAVKGSGDKTSKDGGSSSCIEKTSHRSRKSGKKERRKRRAIIEGEKISFVDRSAVYRRHDDEEAEEESRSGEQDDYVLRRLLKKSGSVHSAMQHDQIMMSSNPDYLLVENEAEQVARKAVQALRESRARVRQTSTPGVPTWTGQNGLAGAPLQSSRPRFGRKRNSTFQTTIPKTSSTLSDAMRSSSSVDSGIAFDGAALLDSNPISRTKSMLSSGELLSRIMTRSDSVQLLAASHDPNDSETSERVQVPRALPSGDELELLTEIRNFIACESSIDGQATTGELIEKFRPQLPPSKSAIFKAMLKQIAVMFREGGAGIWRLKPEFR